MLAMGIAVPFCLIASSLLPIVAAYNVPRPTNPSPIVSRRDVWTRTVEGIALSSLLLRSSGGAALPASAQELKKKTIVVTGANSGIGFEACRRLVSTPGQQNTVILACRTLKKSKLAIERMQQISKNEITGTLIPAQCDLADLQSIESFASLVPTLLADRSGKIDTLCLNAGLCRNTGATDCARTKDGFELTVGTNHFGHFYLNHLLLPSISKDGNIVVTASGVHDPESPGGAQGFTATLGDLDGLQQQGRACEMIDGGGFNADKAYKDSKLCNVLFTRELQRRLDRNDATKGIVVNCFSPGLIVGTGLFRDQNPIFTKLFDLAATDLFKVGETPEWGGASLEYMTNIYTKGLFYNSPPGSSKYGEAAFGTQFVPTMVSREAQDDTKAARLWELSMQTLGVSSLLSVQE